MTRRYGGPFVRLCKGAGCFVAPGEPSRYTTKFGRGSDGIRANRRNSANNYVDSRAAIGLELACGVGTEKMQIAAG
jgi:hypothetical protein